VSTVPDKPTPEEMRRFLADCNLRRTGWAGFQKSARRAAERMARILADDGHTDSDVVTHADIDAAADIAGVSRPAGPDDRHAVRTALDTIQEGR
jgi:hypothetical protein